MPGRRLSILVFVFNTGCSTTTPVDPTLASSPNSTYQAAITSIPEAIPTQSQPTISPVLSTRTATPTFLPTVAPEIQQEIFTKIIEGDSDCRLPCYGGIIPGKSKLQEAIQIFAPLSRDMGGDGASYGFFLKPPSVHHTYASDVLILFRIKPDQTIHQIEGVRYEYPIIQLLNEYGPPDEIQIRPLNYPLMDNPTWVRGMRVWDLAIYYKQGILAKY